eukprot:3941353-Rhodomonas_salina.1
MSLCPRQDHAARACERGGEGARESEDRLEAGVYPAGRERERESLYQLHASSTGHVSVSATPSSHHHHLIIIISSSSSSQHHHLIIIIISSSSSSHHHHLERLPPGHVFQD